jgi:hypothetical protein
VDATEDHSNEAVEPDEHSEHPGLPGCGPGGQGRRRRRARMTSDASAATVAKEVATLRRCCPTLNQGHAKGPAVQGLPMRRRGLEPPPGYPGPGPQPGNPTVRSVQCVHIVQIVQPRGRYGRNGRSGCCRGCCHERRAPWPNATCTRPGRYPQVGSQSRLTLASAGRRDNGASSARDTWISSRAVARRRRAA